MDRDVSVSRIVADEGTKGSGSGSGGRGAVSRDVVRRIDEGTHSSSSSSLPGMSAHALDATISWTADAPRARVSRRLTGAFTALGALDSALARTTDRLVRMTAFTLEAVDANMMVAMLYFNHARR